MTARAFRSLAVVAALALVCGSPHAAPDAPPAKVRFVELPAARVAQLGRNWQPMHRAEFEKLLKQARPDAAAPAGIGVPRADYEATFAGNSLTAGRLSLHVRRRPLFDPEKKGAADWLDLGRVNLAISELQQGERPIVWGTTAAGRVMARVLDDTRPLTGSWTLAGERIGRRYRFAVRLIPATASQLKLKLPRGFRLQASAGSVSGPHTSGEPESREWRVAVSTTDAMLLTVIPPEPAAAEKPIVLLETETAYVVRDSGVQIQFRAIPEVLQRGIDGLTFRMPEEVRVYSVSYGGNSTPLEFTMRKAADGQRMYVRFPDPLLGRGRAVIVQAVADVRWKQRWELPAVDTLDSLFLQGQVHLRVDRPLEFQSLRTTGLRQTTGVSRPLNGETVSFDCQQPDARLQLSVMRPTPLTDCRTVTRLDVVGDQWRATTEMTWTARRGPLYTLRCRAPAGWQLGLLQLVPSLTPENERTVSWTEQRVEQGRRVMSFELPGGLPEGESVTLRIAATRPVRSLRRRLQWPVIAPLDIDRFDSAVLMPPGLLPPQPAPLPMGFRRLYPNDLPDFVRKSKLWTAAASGANKPIALGSRSRSFRRPVFLGKPEPGFDARSWTWVKSNEERVQLSIVPHGDAIDAVLVYLSHKGPKLNWRLRAKGNTQTALPATRLPASRLSVWKLPAAGELWELKLPQPTAKAFHVVAERTQAAGAERLIGLPYLPQARRFAGHVETAGPNESDAVRPESGSELFPVDATDVAAGLRPTGDDVPPLKPAAGLWRYRTPRAGLIHHDSGRGSGDVSQVPVDVELWSVLSASFGGVDAHRIVFRLPPEPRISQFAFRWNQTADVSISSVLLNGRPVAAVAEGDRQTVYSLPAETLNLIEIRYTAPSADVGWSGRRHVAVPRCTRPVGNFRWRFALPPHIALTAGPPALTVRSVSPQPGWRTRLFGPLARSSETPLFNPLSEETWQRLFHAHGAGGRRNGRGTVNEWAPAGWSVHTGVGIEVSDHLSLQLSSRERSRLWAWIGLLFCLMAGWVVRRAGLAWRRKLAALWLSTCLAAALFIPGEFAEFAGACLMGSLIAAVLPRNLIRREAVREESRLDVPPGSTASFPRVVSTSLLVAGAGFLAADSLAAIAQPPASAGGALADAPDATTVVVTAAAEGKPADGSSVVYVHRELLASLKRDAARARSPQYVLQRARYRVSAAGHSADVTATYDAVVVHPELPVTVWLPIRDAALCGADACRVNGRVLPVRREPTGRGFLVDIPAVRNRERNRHDSSDSRELLQATVGLGGSLAHLPERSKPQAQRHCRIELCLQARTDVVQKDERLRIGIPRVASTEFELHLPFDGRAVVVPGLSRVKTERGWLSQSLSGRLAPADVLDVNWGDAASLASRQKKLAAEVRGFAEVGVARIRLRYDVHYQVESGSVNSVVWNVPRGWVLRNVLLADTPTRRPEFRRLPSPLNGRTRMRIDFPTPRSKPFSLTAEFVIPLERPKAKARPGKAKPPRRADASFRFRLQMPRLHADQSPATVAHVVETRNHFAVASSADVGLTVDPVNQASVRALDQVQLTEFRRHFPGSRLPDFVYAVQQPTVLNGSVTPYSPRRSVRQTQTGHIGGGEVQWTLNADVTVETAPAYRHELLVDPRLIVESASVLEDGASRLVRWSRDGNRVHLFLSDKTAATQNVVLKARMPLRPAAVVRLPNIRFADPTVQSSQIRLTREPHVAVTVVDRGDWERAASVANGGDTRGIAVAAFQRPALGPANPRPPRVRSEPRRAMLAARRLTVLKYSKPGWTAECTVEFLDVLPPSEYSVFLPSAAGGATIQNATEWNAIGERRTESGVTRRLRPSTSNGTLPLLTLRFSLPAANARRWELPLPIPVFAELKQDVLAIVKGGEPVTVASAADPVAASALPARLAKRLPASEATLYRGRRREWQLTTATSERNGAGLKIPFLESYVWLGDRTEYGCTQALIATAGRPSVEFRWPENLTLRSVRVNGRRVAAKSDGDRLVVPLASRSLDLVRIDWERDSGSHAWHAGRGEISLPSPALDNQPPSLVTLVPSQRESLHRISGIDALDAVPYALQRMERLLELAAGRPAQDVAAAAALEAASISYRSLTDFLTSRDASPRALDDGVRQRLGRIDATIKKERKRFALPAAADTELQPAFLTMTGVGAGRALHGELRAEDGQAEVRFWHVDRWLLSTLLAASVLVLALPFVRPLFRADIGARLADWEPVSWIVLGTVWWLLLVPSGVGLVLFSVAVAKLVRRWLRRRSSGKVIRLYDLSRSRERRAGAAR